MTATIDPANNMVTSTIGALGTYAVGFDDQPPTIDEIVPASGEAQATYRPQFRITLHDSGSGVDPASLRLEVNGMAVNTTYSPMVGMFWYSPTVPFSNGAYTMSIYTADTTGNAITVTSPFTISVPAPAIGGVTPSQVSAGITSTVEITGSGFYPGLSLNAGSYSLPSYEYLSASALRAELPFTLPVGSYTVTVTNPDVQVGRLVNAIQVVRRYVYLPLISRDH